MHAGPRQGPRRRMGGRRHGRHRRVLHATDRRRTTSNDPGHAGDVLLFPSALTTPHLENNTVRCGYFPARRARDGKRSRAAVIVLPQWNADAGGHVGLCRLLAWNGMSASATEPALSRPADAARTPSRRLHRQRQRRAHAAGLPPGGARRAAGRRVAGERRIRAHRHSGHQPRIVSRAADDGARAIDSCGGAQSHLTGISRTWCGAACRRSTCATGLEGGHRSRSAARAVEADQPAAAISTASAIAQTLLVYAHTT